MYRFSGKLTPGSDIKGQLERWVREEYASSPAHDVPPPPSPMAWLVKGLEAKAASVKHALEKQVRGWASGCWDGPVLHCMVSLAWRRSGLAAV